MRIKQREIRNVYKNGGKLHRNGWLKRSAPISAAELNYIRGVSWQISYTSFIVSSFV